MLVHRNHKLARIQQPDLGIKESLRFFFYLAVLEVVGSIPIAHPYLDVGS